MSAFVVSDRHAAQWCADLDTYAQAVTQEDCDRYMDAYAHIYGCDSAPFWWHRDEGRWNDGVELEQASNGH